MLLKVLDGEGNSQTIITSGQETVVNQSGVIAGAAAQPVMPANASRSGWFFQNTSIHDMHVNDLAAALADGTCMKVAAQGTWPPAGYPLSTGALSVIGTPADTYIAREW